MKSSSSKNLYDILGVSSDATEEVIKKTFKQLAMKYHPDRGGDADKFKEINEAYAILSDPQKRKNYDQYGSAEMAEAPPMPDINDLMENLFGGSFPFGGMMGAGGMMGGRSGQKKAPSKHLELEVSLEDIYKGSSIQMKLNKKIFIGNAQANKCKECKGQGNVVQQMNMGFMVTQNISQCPKCLGTGSFYTEKDFKTISMDIEIPLPKGCIEGNKICIRGKGDEYPNMESGDLIFTIKYKPHSFYYTVESEIGDLFCNIDITLYEFLYGFSRVIPFLNGEYIKIVQPANTSMSNIISKPIIKVIRNKGLTFKNHVGDLNLIFQINIPLLKESQNKVFHDLLKTSKYNNCQPFVSEDTSFCETYNLQNL